MYKPCWRPPKNCHCICVLPKTILFFSSHVYLTHTRKICYNNANNNTHISIFCDRHVCHSSLTSFGKLLQVYAYTRYNLYWICNNARKERRENKIESCSCSFWIYKYVINFYMIHKNKIICHKNICCHILFMVLKTWIARWFLEHSKEYYSGKLEENLCIF